MDPYLCARLLIFAFCIYGAVQYTRRSALPIQPEPQLPSPMDDMDALLAAVHEETKVEMVQRGRFVAARPHLPEGLTSQQVRVGDEWLPWDQLTEAQKACAALHYLEKA